MTAFGKHGLQFGKSQNYSNCCSTYMYMYLLWLTLPTNGDIGIHVHVHVLAHWGFVHTLHH